MSHVKTAYDLGAAQAEADFEKRAFTVAELTALGVPTGAAALSGGSKLKGGEYDTLGRVLGGAGGATLGGVGGVTAGALAHMLSKGRIPLKPAIAAGGLTGAGIGGYRGQRSDGPQTEE